MAVAAPLTAALLGHGAFDASAVNMTATLLAAAKHLAEGSSDDFYKAKLATAEYFATHQLPFAAAYAAEVTGGAASTLGLAETLF